MNTAPNRLLTGRNKALTALATAGLLWGTSVPLSKTALASLGPAWLTVIRFAVAGLLLLVVARPTLRGNVSLKVMLWGAIGYGGCIALQNAGLARTSVTHAALLIGAVPVLVAVLAVFFESARVSLGAWLGFALSLVGIALVATAGGGAASLGGDALVLASVLISAAFTLIQTRLLTGSDVVAVSVAQFLASAVAIAPIAVLTEGSPLPRLHPGAVAASGLLAIAALAVIGTVLPYTLFALGQSGVQSHIAGAFLNLETLVATAIGVTLFGEALTLAQGAGAIGLVAGIYLSTGLAAAPPAASPVADDLQPIRSRRLAADTGDLDLELALERDGEPVFARAA
jgi:O-acetylserine/cysteine efflux transporter